MLSVGRNTKIPYIGARWCRRLSDIVSAETMGLTLEYRFRQQHVHALGAVDDLRDMQVALRAQQHERVVARQAFGLDDEVEHFADRDFRGLVQVSYTHLTL